MIAKKYVLNVGKELTKLGINYQGFVYNAALRPPPRLNRNIVNLQLKYIEQNNFIDDEKAKILLKTK